MKELFWPAVFVFLAALLLKPMLKVDKDGFADYIVMGPGFHNRRPWMWHYRPYWHRRFFWNGPCPGPWCPYF